MKKILITSLLLIQYIHLHGQHTLLLTVKDAQTHSPLAHVTGTLLGTNLTTQSNQLGHLKIQVDHSQAAYQLLLKAQGYETDTITFAYPFERKQAFLVSSQKVLNEFVVTGFAKSQFQKDNSLSIVLIQERALNLSTETNIISGLSKLTPGLASVSTGPNISKPFIRGLGYNRVLTLYDGIRQEGQQWGDEHGVEVDPYVIQKAEVIKGPASLMFGSDAMAGVVNLIPFQPKITLAKPSVRVVSEYQHNNGLLGNGFQYSHSFNKTAFIFSASHRIARDYQNRIDQRVYNTGFQEFNLRLGLVTSGKRWTCSINGTHYNNLQEIPDGSRDTLTRLFTKQIAEQENDIFFGRPTVSQQELKSYYMGPLHQHILHSRIYANAKYFWSNSSVQAQLGGQQNQRIEFTHPTDPKQAGMWLQLNTLNYALNYSCNRFQDFEYTVGINGFIQQNKNKNATDFPIPNYTLVDAGAFLLFNHKGKSCSLNAGIRYDQRNLYADEMYIKTMVGSPFMKEVHLPDTAGASLQFNHFSSQYHGVSVSVGAAFHLSPTVNLKANLARGYRAPSVTELLSNGLDPGAHIHYVGSRSLQPEFNLQQDMVLEKVGKSFNFSCSVFHNWINNFIYLLQVTDAAGSPLADPQGNKTYSYHTASAQLYGTEAQLNYTPTFLKGVQYNASFGMLWGINKKAEFEGQKTMGEYLPLIQPFMALQGLTWETKPKIKRIQALNFKADLDYCAAQNRYLALNNTESATPAYTLIHLGINAKITTSINSNMLLVLSVNNVANTVYQSHLSRLKYFEYANNLPQGRSGIQGMGRNICVKVIFTF